MPNHPSCIIDFHVHPPDILSSRRLTAQETAKRLLEEMDSIGICRILLYALEVNVERFKKHVTKKKLLKALEHAVGYGLYSLPGYLSKLLEDPDTVLEEHVELLKKAHTPSGFVLEVSKHAGGRIVPIASPDPSMPRDMLLDMLDSLLRQGVLGVKLLPTIQLIDDKVMDRVEAIAELLEERGKVLIIHTGCDPGVWELPAMCETARPSRFTEIARRHRDLFIVFAHMGGYSALRPGIFMHEALELMKSLPNVYGDTAALEPELVEYAVKRVGPDKVLFGSDYPVVVGATWRHLVESIAELRLPPSWIERIMWMNAEEILKTLDS